MYEGRIGGPDYRGQRGGWTESPQNGSTTAFNKQLRLFQTGSAQNWLLLRLFLSDQRGGGMALLAPALGGAWFLGFVLKIKDW